MLFLRIGFALCSLMSAVALARQTPQPTSAPSVTSSSAVDRRVLIISIDGLRPDCALRADMPNLRALMARGCFTMWARTTDIAITLPSHTSMVTGVTPAKHTIDWNDDVPPGKLHYPAFPTIFELAKAHGYSTALVSGKSKFIALARPGSVDWLDLPNTTLRRDTEVGAVAARIIALHQPQVMMVHFGDNDAIGHSAGWGTPEQIDHLHVTDAQLGVLFDAMRPAGVLGQTLIILTADHGGFERIHGPNPNDDRAQTIPWIVAGPHVREGFDLTRIRSLHVRTYDTFATAAAYLGLTPSPDIDGHPIDVIFDDVDLLHDAARAAATTRPSTTQPSLTTQTPR